MRRLRFTLQYLKPGKPIKPAGAPAPTDDLEKRDKHRVLTFSSLSSVVWATVLIDTLILVFAASVVWAVGGYLHLKLLPFAILTLSVAVSTIWACVSVAILAYNAETDPVNNASNLSLWKQFTPEQEAEKTGRGQMDRPD